MTLLCQAYQIENRDGILKAVLGREEKMSTGIGCGLAVPHGKVDFLDKMCVVAGLGEARHRLRGHRQGAGLPALPHRFPVQYHRPAYPGPVRHLPHHGRRGHPQEPHRLEHARWSSTRT